MSVVLDWNAIRPLNGSRASGFEELCTQLADAEVPNRTDFIRKGTPDAGVECFVTFADGSEWGWQAKYFDTLGDSQWAQLDKSVSTVLDKHPKLTRSFICVPLDRPDARVKGQTSALERWNDHVKKWTGWATARGMTVEFIWWGSAELLALLVKPEHVGRVRFWFDATRFDEKWFSVRLEEALKSAGPRYTPELNVELPIANKFEAFGRTKTFFDDIKRLARRVRKETQHLQSIARDGIDERVNDRVASLLVEAEKLLPLFAQIQPVPIGPLEMDALLKSLEDTSGAANKLESEVFELETKDESKKARDPYSDPLHRGRRGLAQLRYELDEVLERIRVSVETSESALFILTGKAGTGKTHLLCDVATARLYAGYPTVLLMGQRYTTSDDPWAQTLRHLDLSDISAEEFIGALECAGQVANCRALLIIDALNEGRGRDIWPPHLPAFVAQCERSPWIGVVLSIRSPYEEIIIPDDVRKKAVVVEHEGFAEHEYDAVKAFFTHYELNLPSAPLLVPEFSNPLFLSTMCRGLKNTGQKELPRGLRGITAIFNLYLDSINTILARHDRADFNPKRSLVSEALEALCAETTSTGQTGVPLARAEEIVNQLHSAKGHASSLYHGLVTESLIIEQAYLNAKGGYDDVAVIAYERLADHLMARMLIDKHLELEAPEKAFEKDGPLAFLWNNTRYVPSGLIEAFSVQIPERTGKELFELGPNLKKKYVSVGAFLESIVWRDVKAFSKASFSLVNNLLHDRRYDYVAASSILEALLTCSTVAQHPFNADSLHSYLLKNSMPDRDAWWSTYLSKAYGQRYAIDRLVDWAQRVGSNEVLDDDAVDFAATTMAWFLSSSNRYLRDKTTKALVSLLTGRTSSVVALIERFKNVDDPYVAERIYAVAYGVVMRNSDANVVGEIATCVYTNVFEKGAPPAHILLRDYARGIIERALYLKANIAVDAQRIRPPYVSQWPTIPTKDEYYELRQDVPADSEDKGSAIARSVLVSSICVGDFARYVIGTNFHNSDWLALQHADEWKSRDQQLSELVAELSTEELAVWNEYKRTVQPIPHFSVEQMQALLADIKFEEADSEQVAAATGASIEHTIEHSQRVAWKEASAQLEAGLSPEHFERLEALVGPEKNKIPNQPPKFDLGVIQRYILGRVFALGWTVERFGYFDRYDVQVHGREAHKAERIGKKYQWIAYHEIMGYVADHYQYRDNFHDGNKPIGFEGAWQDSGLRDIDPSVTKSSIPGGTKWGPNVPAWWGDLQYEDWNAEEGDIEWTKREDLPNIEHFLCVTDPKDGSRWINLHGHFDSKQPVPPDRDDFEVARRDIWLSFQGYLVRTEDAEVFIEWAKEIEIWGQFGFDDPSVGAMFLGEYGWSPVFEYYQRPYFAEEGWRKPHDCPVEVRQMVVEYLSETGTHDCSIDESFKLRLPISDLLNGLDLRWAGTGADFIDSFSTLIAYDPTAHESGPDALLVREDALRDYLAKNGLTVCWTVLYEKRAHGPGFATGSSSVQQALGAFKLDNKGPSGFLHVLEEQIEDDGSLDDTQDE